MGDSNSNRAEMVAIKQGPKLFKERCSGSLLVEANCFVHKGGSKSQWRLEPIVTEKTRLMSLMIAKFADIPRYWNREDDCLAKEGI